MGGCVAMPSDRFSKAKANSKPLQEFMATPEVSEWLEIDVRGKETKRTYASALFRYWTGFLSKAYPTLKAWVEAVRTQRESKEANVRKTWAIDLQRFMDTQKTPNGLVERSISRFSASDQRVRGFSISSVSRLVSNSSLIQERP